MHYQWVWGSLFFYFLNYSWVIILSFSWRNFSRVERDKLYIVIPGIMICHQRLFHLTNPIIPWSQRFSLSFLRTIELNLNLTDARVRIWPLGSDWLIFLQARKSIWLVRLIGNIGGTVGIFVTALLVVTFAYLYQGKNLLAKYFTSQFIYVQDSSVSLIVSSKKFWPWHWKSVFQRLKVSPNVSLAVIIASMCCQILPTGHKKSIIIQLISNVGKYLYLTSYSYPH